MGGPGSESGCWIHGDLGLTRTGRHAGAITFCFRSAVSSHPARVHTRQARDAKTRRNSIFRRDGQKRTARESRSLRLALLLTSFRTLCFECEMPFCVLYFALRMHIDRARRDFLPAVRHSAQAAALFGASSP
ncbi:hypothetical protein BRPE64_DCDS04630 (plasmid) [Caballeronia insecticola]|uniref:Uncharacterized protein n=1 Tax=Caballeronia insecticola TaxID=758793 RepID=R4WS35_9BURK|nr:hypothetical protein BRPE64_DCDS04630 [Caballeronia insecticola]